MRTFWCVFLSVLFSLPVYAQDCDLSSHPLSAPTERFTDNGDGTVTDKSTGSIWMRCSLGQQWDGKSCVGEPRLYTWSQIETLADEFNLDGYAGHDDWRIPNLPELASITEQMCKHPRINEEVFPHTAQMAYWTSMNKPGTNEIYVMNFGEGGVAGMKKDYKGPIRMLRGERWWVPPSVREMRKQEQQQGHN